MNDIAKEYAKNLFESPAKSLYSNYTYERKPLGENVYIDNKKSPENIFQEWYDENKYYNYDLKKFQKNSLHFAQLVWKETKSFEFSYIASGNKCCLVILYYPPGNFFERFNENVENHINNVK